MQNDPAALLILLAIAIIIFGPSRLGALGGAMISLARTFRAGRRARPEGEAAGKER